MTTTPSVRLTLTRLEPRDVPAFSSIDTTGTLVVAGTDAADEITVSEFIDQGVPWVRVDLGADTESHLLSDVRRRKVQIFGFGGDDVLTNDHPRLRAWIDAGDGADTLTGDNLSDSLYGGAGDDVIRGWAGGDLLDGGAGNDILYAGPGYDRLFGRTGDDFLDMGTGGGYLHGGPGLDTSATRWAIAGGTRNDIFQMESNTSWFLASLGAGTRTWNYARDFIRYTGEGTYSVFLYDQAAGDWKAETVEFNGFVHAGDAAVVSYGNTAANAPGVEGEYWVTLMQRAMHAHFGINYLDPDAVWNADYGYGAGSGGWAVDGFVLLGLGAQDIPVTDFVTLRRAMALGLPVVAETVPGPEQTSGKLVGVHNAYEVVRVSFDGTVLLRNPWGVDGCQDGTTMGADDGYIALTWTEFVANFEFVTAGA
ncbi:MAG TPA: hypothetical protein VKD90_27495 [Gemmataceae bacterium]|nr:hypothetical protein [Gemmataceae bacterium]